MTVTIKTRLWLCLLTFPLWIVPLLILCTIVAIIFHDIEFEDFKTPTLQDSNL